MGMYGVQLGKGGARMEVLTGMCKARAADIEMFIQKDKEMPISPN